MENTLAEFTLRSPMLAATLDACPNARVTLVQETIPDDRPAKMAIWAVADRDAFESALDDDPTVCDYETLSAPDERVLYHVDVAPDTRERLTYDDLMAAGGVLLSAVVGEEGWRIRARFPSRDALNRYYDACRERDIGFSLERLYTAPDDEERASDRLTDPQREALATALEMGYFEIPREATANDVGDRLDISGQAVSERLRRAVRTAARRALWGGS